MMILQTKQKIRLLFRLVIIASKKSDTKKTKQYKDFSKCLNRFDFNHQFVHNVNLDLNGLQIVAQQMIQQIFFVCNGIHVQDAQQLHRACVVKESNLLIFWRFCIL